MSLAVMTTMTLLPWSMLNSLLTMFCARLDSEFFWLKAVSLYTITLLLAKNRHKLGKKEENLKTIVTQANAASKKGVELLVFPELHLTGYTMQDEVYNLAEPIPGPSVKRVEKLAKEHGLHIVFGMPEESAVKGVIHNTAVLVGPNGLVGKYRKIHLPTHTVFEERRYYRPGQEAPVFSIPLGTIGLTIC